MILFYVSISSADKYFENLCTHFGKSLSISWLLMSSLLLKWFYLSGSTIFPPFGFIRKIVSKIKKNMGKCLASDSALVSGDDFTTIAAQYLRFNGSTTHSLYPKWNFFLFTCKGNNHKDCSLDYRILFIQIQSLYWHCWMVCTLMAVYNIVGYLLPIVSYVVQLQ